MKVTKNILREIIEAEMNLLNEKIGSGGLNDRGDVRRLNQKLADRDLTGFKNLVSSEFQNLTQEDWDNHTDLLRIFTTANGLEGWEDSGASGVILRAEEEGFVPDTIINQTQVASNATLDALEPERSTDSAGRDPVVQYDGLNDSHGLEAADLTLLEYLHDGNRILQSGSPQTSHVEALQRILLVRLRQNSLNSEASAMKAATSDETGVDGDFGGKTKAAVVALQRKYGIDDDGAVGRQTFMALRMNKAVDGVAASNVRTRQRAETETLAQVVPAADAGAANADPDVNPMPGNPTGPETEETAEAAEVTEYDGDTISLATADSSDQSSRDIEWAVSGNSLITWGHNVNERPERLSHHPLENEKDAMDSESPQHWDLEGGNWYATISPEGYKLYKGSGHPIDNPDQYNDSIRPLNAENNGGDDRWKSNFHEFVIYEGIALSKSRFQKLAGILKG